MSIRNLWILFTLSACGGDGSADLQVDLDGMDFDGRISVYHGGRHIVIIDRAFDCRDIGWIRTNYFGTPNPASSSTPFAALQFTFDGVDGAITEGTFALEGANSPTTGWILDNLDVPASGSPPPLDAQRARTASLLDIDEVNDRRVQGSFEAFFGQGTASGTFRTTYCRNLL
ncbi:MAG: hypothetical protein EA397_14790 [Deltaproteobacteria bacterium]|nr:MAG: hypothetical protein EA397_14790 [Deltaproteobacteria bacterium]